MRKKKFFAFVTIFLCFLFGFYVVFYVKMPWFPNVSCIQLVHMPVSKPQTELDPVTDPVLFSGSANGHQCPGGELVYDRFCAYGYWRKADRLQSNEDKVTLCTQGTPQFLHHATFLCDSWNGPISLAVYCPGQGDFDDTRRTIYALRNCSSCVRQHVDWHLFFEENDGPVMVDNDDDLESPNCNSPRNDRAESSEKKRNRSYPINVARNIARDLSSTQYIFPSDIELYPSSDVKRRFELMLQLQNQTAFSNKRQVYVLPVFEVWSKYKPPRTKEQLRNMYHKKQAISFHKYRCNICHKIPNVSQWINYTSSDRPTDNTSAIDELLQPLKIWSTVHRSRPFGLQEWEPFFIGTRDIPKFDPRLSWEGKQNKMQVAYEMCLMGYDFHILDDAFLVHAPGVNMYNAAKEKFRSKYMVQNFYAMKTIKKELHRKYGKRSGC